MSERLRIAVTGLAVTYPLGGVFWDYLQYVLGFHRLGHDVLYVEDTGRWSYDPGRATFVEGGAANAAGFARHIEALDPALGDRWFFRDGTGATYGRAWTDVVRFCASADLFLHVSASCWMRDEYFAADRVAFVDSDPMYTQASVPAYLDGTASEDERARIDMLRAHDAFLTFGELVGRPGCAVPTELFDWRPTRQPVVLDVLERHAVPVPQRRQAVTTVASWEPAESGPVVKGVAYTGKSTEFRRFLGLAARSPLPLELAISGEAPFDEMRRLGWRLADAQSASSDPWRYLGHLARSAGEWSVAKNAYVASRSGWFSCRTACYLAMGVPAVVQDTGFSEVLPTGDGLFAFDDDEEALDGLRAISSDPVHHAAAARDIARERFASDRVLRQLLDDVAPAGAGATREMS